MSKIIIGIHGLGNKPTEKKLYRNGWKKAILEGISHNLGITGRDINFEGVYWADKMYKSPDTDADTYRKAKAGTIKTYKDGFFDDVISPIENVIGSGIDWFKKTFSVNDLADAAIKKKLKDLDRYYNDEAKRTELVEQLKSVLREHADKRILLVAHSMGSIIAYDALRELGRTDGNLNIEHFVTIGSPLGLPHIVGKIRKTHGSVKTPTVVKRWTNYADRRDPVAADERLADDFSPNFAGITVTDDLVLNDWRVKEGIDIYHKSYGYLRTPEVTNAMVAFL
ncbi:hypothetical protein AB833_10540 [Chromatiales bacterium (ex Bugula neritina AB1)]|nr:hypothetical protein AB833_10540 [Chromatiales bacterium (ex Bugula neritina AB1)]